VCLAPEKRVRILRSGRPTGHGVLSFGACLYCGRPLRAKKTKPPKFCPGDACRRAYDRAEAKRLSTSTMEALVASVVNEVTSLAATEKLQEHFDQQRANLRVAALPESADHPYIPGRLRQLAQEQTTTHQFDRKRSCFRCQSFVVLSNLRAHKKQATA
jgi:hypothetical protein